MLPIMTGFGDIFVWGKFLVFKFLTALEFTSLDLRKHRQAQKIIRHRQCKQQAV
jgi:hypothetical protein